MIRSLLAITELRAAHERVRRSLRIAALISISALAYGLATDLVTEVSLANTTAIEPGKPDRFQNGAQFPAIQRPLIVAAARSDLPNGEPMPSFSGATAWPNSPPLTPGSLKGHVVLVTFWTYTCINSLRPMPYIRAWAEKYRDQGLVVIGVHTPEFSFERKVENVKRAISRLKIGYPIAVDNDYAIWDAFGNELWPAFYIIDAKGLIRHKQFGEGNYDQSEHAIQQLLAKASNHNVSSKLVSVDGKGIEAQADWGDLRPPETYIGYQKTNNFVSPGGAVRDASHTYATGAPTLNEWGLSGDWTIRQESAALNKSGGGITFVFHARDLHLVLGTDSGEPVRFRITVDGAAPRDSHGIDVDEAGDGVVTEQRLYQLVRTVSAVRDHVFTIQFLDPGAQAYVFTFG